MKLFVGLGNPGSKYERTRHNAGFMVIDELSKAWNIDLSEEKRISIAFMVRKIFQKFHLKQMFQMSYYITMNMLMERVHFRRHGRKHHYLQELFILLI